MTIQSAPTCLKASQSPTHEEARPAEHLWFEDGNLILQAEKCLFRIYGGLLASRSSVFKDMLAFPPPEDGNKTMHGCPIVFVYDSASDMSYFLRAIFDSSYFEPPPTPTAFPIVDAVLRLSLKYDVPYLRRRALTHLSSTFPTTLSSWKTRDQQRTIPPVDNTPFAVLRLARMTDLPWLVPSIMYCISSHPFDKTLDSALWEGERIELAWEVKRTAIVGRQKLIAMQNQSALGITRLEEKQLEGCTGEEGRCAETRQQCADVLGAWDMAGFLDYFEDNTECTSTLCPTCHDWFEARCAADSQAMWNALPDMFGLPDWEDLEKQRARALE